MAAIAFYVEEADGIELIIHSGLQEILNQEKQVNYISASRVFLHGLLCVFAERRGTGGALAL